MQCLVPDDVVKPRRPCAGNLGLAPLWQLTPLPFRPAIKPHLLLVRAARLNPLVRLGRGAFSDLSLGDDPDSFMKSVSIPLGRLVPLPTPLPDHLRLTSPHCVRDSEESRDVRRTHLTK